MAEWQTKRLLCIGKYDNRHVIVRTGRGTMKIPSMVNLEPISNIGMVEVSKTDEGYVMSGLVSGQYEVIPVEIPEQEEEEEEGETTRPNPPQALTHGTDVWDDEFIVWDVPFTFTPTVADNLQSYKVYYTVNGPDFILPIGLSAAYSLPLVPGDVWTTYVVAIDTEGRESGPSNVLGGTTAVAPNPPPPTGVSVIAIPNGTRVTWAAPTGLDYASTEAWIGDDTGANIRVGSSNKGVVEFTWDFATFGILAFDYVWLRHFNRSGNFSTWVSAGVANMKIDTPQLADDSITATQIEAGAVTDIKILTTSNLAKMLIGKVQTNISGGGNVSLTTPGLLMTTSARFVVIPTSLSSSGFIEIGPFVSVNMTGFVSLFYRFAIGAASTFVNTVITPSTMAAGYFVCGSGSYVAPPITSGFVDFLIATHNNDSTLLHLFDGRVLKPGQTITGGNILPNDGVETAHINALAVTNAKIAALAVDGPKLASGAVTAGKIGVGGVSASNQFAANVVDSTAINTDAVTTGKILDGAVTTGKVGAGAIDGSKLAATVNITTQVLTWGTALMRLLADGMRIRADPTTPGDHAFIFEAQNGDEIGRLYGTGSNAASGKINLDANTNDLFLMAYHEARLRAYGPSGLVHLSQGGGSALELSSDRMKWSTGGGFGSNVIFDADGNVLIGDVALATTATNGFLYVNTCAGKPTGTPTSNTGVKPIVYDTTNKIFWLYDGGWKALASEGTAFPASPYTDMRFYRSDLHVECYYDGTRWLGPEKTIVWSDRYGTLQPYSIDGDILYEYRIRAGKTLFVKSWALSTNVVTPNSGSDYWTVALLKASDATDITTKNTSADAANTWVQQTEVTSFTGNPFTPASVAGFAIQIRATGTPGNIYLDFELIYQEVYS